MTYIFKMMNDGYELYNAQFKNSLSHTFAFHFSTAKKESLSVHEKATMQTFAPITRKGSKWLVD